jgi:hypothetical protein
MDSRERIKTVLEHRAADRVAVDFGGTAVTGIHALAIERLRSYLGLEKKPVKVIEPYQMLGEIDTELKEIIGIDTIGVIGLKNMFGISNEHWKEFRMPWGQVVLLPGNFNMRREADGSLLVYPEGDMTVAPSAKMPSSGYFFDAIIRQDLFDENHLDVNDNLEEFTLLSGDDLI